MEESLRAKTNLWVLMILVFPVMGWFFNFLIFFFN